MSHVLYSVVYTLRPDKVCASVYLSLVSPLPGYGWNSLNLIQFLLVASEFTLLLVSLPAESSQLPYECVVCPWSAQNIAYWVWPPAHFRNQLSCLLIMNKLLSLMRMILWQSSESNQLWLVPSFCWNVPSLLRIHRDESIKILLVHIQAL